MANESKLTINLNHFKILQNGFLKKNGLRVSIKTGPMDWNTGRTYEDFKWLHVALKCRFPANYIPELPEVKANEDSKAGDMYLLSTYLNHIVGCPDLVYSPELSAFLKLDDSSFAKVKVVDHRLCLDANPIIFQKGKGYSRLQPTQANRANVDT